MDMCGLPLDGVEASYCFCLVPCAVTKQTGLVCADAVPRSDIFIIPQDDLCLETAEMSKQVARVSFLKTACRTLTFWLISLLGLGVKWFYYRKKGRSCLKSCVSCLRATRAKSLQVQSLRQRPVSSQNAALRLPALSGKDAYPAVHPPPPWCPQSGGM